MDTWRIIVSYDASLPADQQDAIDAELDRLAEASGEVVDSGSGSGFGRRDLDYAYGTPGEASALASVIEEAFQDRVVTADLEVQIVEPDDEEE